MKDNRYTRAMDSVEIGSEALEAGLRYAAAERYKVIFMKKSKMSYWKTAAVAACLAVVIGVGGVIGHNFAAKPENVFIITANAEELSGDAKVVIGEFYGTGAGVSINDDGTVQVTKHIEFPIVCRGKDIDSVTISTAAYNNDDVQMNFVIQEDFADQIDNNGEINVGDKTKFIPNTVVASEYTVPYDMQENIGASAESPIVLSLAYNGVPEDFGLAGIDELNEKIENGELEFFSTALNECMSRDSENMMIDVTTNFNDGSSKTERIKLGFEPVGYLEDFTLIAVTGMIVE